MKKGKKQRKKRGYAKTEIGNRNNPLALLETQVQKKTNKKWELRGIETKKGGNLTPRLVLRLGLLKVDITKSERKN